MSPWRPALLLAAVASTIAQAQPTFRATVNAVRLDVSVTTGWGLPVHGLTADNFVVTDNGVPQTITSVTLDEQLPLRIGLALDTSGSVEGSTLAALVDASLALVDALRPGDRLALLTFSGQVALVSPFGATHQEVSAALRHVRAGGRTALYDALQTALELVRADQAGPMARPLVLVCSDGKDTGSWLDRQQLLEAVRRTGVTAHAIVQQEPVIKSDSGNGAELFRRVGFPGVPVSEMNDRGIGFLKEFTNLSGGRTWPASNLKGTFLQALTEMRARYLLTFSPPTTPAPGWHSLTVRLKNATGNVRARPGYYVEKQPSS